MKKENSIISEKVTYDILSEDIARVISSTGKSCLINLKTHEFIGQFDEYDFNFLFDETFYIQGKHNNSEEYVDYVNVYDVERQRYIVENYLHEESNYKYDYTIFQNPETKKYRLFDIKTIRNETNIFNEEFDSIETVLSEDNGTYTVVEQNGKKGIYKKGIGITTPIEYDEIKKMNLNYSILIYEKNGKSYFSFYNAKDGIVESPLFDSIMCEDEYSGMLYCKINNNIVIYDVGEYPEGYRIKLLGKFPVFDEIKSLNIDDGSRSIFLVKRNGKYGLYSLYFDRDDDFYFSYERDNDDKARSPYIKIVEPTYDKIEKEYNNYFLYKDGKVGLYTRIGCKEINYIIEPIYDDIRVFDETYLLFSNGLCNIVTLDSLKTPHVTNCEFVKNYSNEIIFKKNGKYGIYISTRQKITIIKDLDNIIYKLTFDSENPYLTKKNLYFTRVVRKLI